MKTETIEAIKQTRANFAKVLDLEYAPDEVPMMLVIVKVDPKTERVGDDVRLVVEDTTDVSQLLAVFDAVKDAIEIKLTKALTK